MPRFRETPVTVSLLVFIAVIFAAEWSLGGPRLTPLRWDILVEEINPNILLTIGSITRDALRGHQYWRLMSGMFLHANFTHWLLNSWTLYQLGSLYEAMFGSRRVAFIYLVTGLCASVISALHLPPNGASVGASGAVLGILGAFIFSIQRSRWVHERWARFLLYQLIFWGIVNITLPYFFPVIDQWAHLAGMGSGLILGLVLPHAHKGPAPMPPSRHVVDVMPFDE